MHRFLEWLHRAGLFAHVTVNVQNLQIINTSDAKGPKGAGTVRRALPAVPAVVAQRQPLEIKLLPAPERSRPSDTLKASAGALWLPVLKDLDKRR
jgi:hypothetical protein